METLICVPLQNGMYIVMTTNGEFFFSCTQNTQINEFSWNFNTFKCVANGWTQCDHITLVV